MTLCGCGCGKPTPMYQSSRRDRGQFAGQPMRFIPKHGAAPRSAEDFWARVAVGDPDECWLWTGSRFKDGYGRLNYQGSHFLAHRLAFILTHGAITSEVVRHRCDVPPCCNPQHLVAGTYADNRRDCVERGRHVVIRGEENAAAKLTWDHVDEIRRRYGLGGVTQQSLGDEYGVSQGAISDVVLGETWARR